MPIFADREFAQAIWSCFYADTNIENILKNLPFIAFISSMKGTKDINVTMLRKIKDCELFLLYFVFHFISCISVRCLKGVFSYHQAFQYQFAMFV